MTDLRVVPWPGASEETEQVVQVLEALLDVARKGEVTNFLFVGINRDGGALSARSFEPGTQRYALIGAIHDRLSVLHRVLAQDEQNETVFSPPPGAG